MIDPKHCSHRRPVHYVYEEVEVGLFGETETQLVERGGESTYEDISIGSFQCTQCGHVGYYTGRWRDYFEKGVPCPGSEGVPRK